MLSQLEGGIYLPLSQGHVVQTGIQEPAPIDEREF